MLKILLMLDVIQVVSQVKDWCDVIVILCQFLIDNGLIEVCYVEVIYCFYEVIGFYYVVGLGIVMLYVCLEEGVNKFFLVLIVIIEGVIFYVEGNDLVKLFIVLVVIDSISYIEVIF